jgi:hypothetical protein
VLAIQDFQPIGMVILHWPLSVQLWSQTAPALLSTTQGHILERVLGVPKERSQNGEPAWMAEKTVLHLKMQDWELGLMELSHRSRVGALIGNMSQEMTLM